ncbi:MAG: meiotic cell cortex C-terminal pleckstrin homology-domain-containing protein [Linnemannia gamsii]|nr:MAG: meiotic cell cortex C-terminal pleckstrin homology-domain-containing protein [Linnemannia gamsii]
MTTGAAIISSTTRTAYTFQNSSSQVYIPQSTQQQPQYQHITDSSGASISHTRGYRPSPNGSVSSMSTDYGGNQRDRRGSVSSNYDSNTATDPTMIQAITQTMIGDYLWKYTRRPMASVISEKRHRRYFWVHPYNKTIYWSLNNPAADGSREQRAKSALIIAVFQITDENTSGNSELPNVSLLVQTSNRNLKLTAPSREKHELWYQSLAYLLSRPSTPGVDMPSDNQTWTEVQAARGVASDSHLTIRNEKTIRKKGSFNRLQSMFGRSKENSPTGSPRQQHQGSGMSSTSVNFSGMPPPPPLSGGSGGNGSVNSVVGYPSHMVNSQSGVGGYGTLNGGPIMSQATSSSNNSTSPRSRLHQSSSGAYEDEYRGEGEYDDGEDDEEDDDEDDDDGELPEHVRQCCDGKHDIGSLDHHH